MDSTADRIIGRDREIAQLGLALGSGTDGLRFAMLTGPSGLGKTTLHGALLEIARERGFRTVSIDGRAGALSTPYAPWREALPELAGVLDVTGATLDIDQVGAALVAVLAEITVAQPVLLSFDDAQALDESSIALLGYAAGVSERLNMTLLVVEQTDAIGVASSYRAMVDGLLARRIVNRQELGPLSVDATRELVASVLGLEDPADVPSEIVLRSGGNPWFAKELAASYQRGDSEIPVNIAAAATARLHSLPEGSQDLVNAVALCPDGAHIGWLETLAGQKPREFVRSYEAIMASGLIREDVEMVTIAHPLMQQALADELSAAMKRAVHLELAEVVAATPTNAVLAARAEGYHLSCAGKIDAAVACYLRAADSNGLSGQIFEAAADFGRALDAETRVEHRAELLRLAAFAAMEIGNERAVEHWNELGRIAAANNDNDTYAFALVQQYYTSFDGSASDRLERAAALGVEQHGWSARAAALMAMRDGDFPEAIRLDHLALDLARKTDDPQLEALALVKLGASYNLHGDSVASIETCREAIALCIRNRYHGWAVDSWADLSTALLWNLSTEEAIQETRAALTYVDDHRLEKYRAMTLSFRGIALVESGSLDEATRIAADAHAALAMSQRHRAAIVASIRAEIASEIGDVSTSTALVHDAAELVRKDGFASYEIEIQFSEARVAALTGDADRVEQIARAFDTDEVTTVARFALWLARYAVRSSKPALLTLAHELVRGIDQGINPLVQLCIDEIVALAAAGSSVDLAVLEPLVGRWQEAGRLLDAARMTVNIAALQVATGQRAEALARFQDVKQRLAKLGAVGDSDFVTSQLRGLGSRSRAKSRQTNTGGLTRRELQIARLVASGLRNAEVAQQLFLAEKTVAAHLSNIYGKVDVNSRVQLASWLGVNDAVETISALTLTGHAPSCGTTPAEVATPSTRGASGAARRRANCSIASSVSSWTT